jgi:hypothetical protein
MDKFQICHGTLRIIRSCILRSFTSFVCLFRALLVRKPPETGPCVCSECGFDIWPHISSFQRNLSLRNLPELDYPVFRNTGEIWQLPILLKLSCPPPPIRVRAQAQIEVRVLYCSAWRVSLNRGPYSSVCRISIAYTECPRRKGQYSGRS